MHIEFRRPAGQIERLQTAFLQHRQHQVDGLAIHHFGAVRPGIDMAMLARLVAQISKIDLQGIEFFAPHRREIGPAQQWICGVHGSFRMKN